MLTKLVWPLSNLYQAGEKLNGSWFDVVNYKPTYICNNQVTSDKLIFGTNFFGKAYDNFF